MSAPDAAPGGIAWMPLLAGLGVMLSTTLYPAWLSDADGKADHPAAVLACAAMAAGFVRGVGYVPRHALPRALLSGRACLAYLSLAGLRLYLLHA